MTTQELIKQALDCLVEGGTQHPIGSQEASDCYQRASSLLRRALDDGLLSTAEAADYLGLGVPAIKYHIYQGNIEPQRIGNSLVFTQAQLDLFKATRRKPGRPRKTQGE
jgi:hypothetical protein